MAIGQRKVDIYAGLNVLILLLELHRYAQTQDELKDKINFYPCGQPDTEEFDRIRLLRMIGYSQCLGADAYTSILGRFLSGAFLSGAFLSGAFLVNGDFRGAFLSGAFLSGAFLVNGDF